MTDLDQNALDAACKAFAAGRYGSAQATASERDQVTGAITAYLAKRREQGWVETKGAGWAIDRARAAVGSLPAIYAQFGPSRDGTIERGLIAVIAASISAAVEEEREACARQLDEFVERYRGALPSQEAVLDVIEARAISIRSRSSQGEK